MSILAVIVLVVVALLLIAMLVAGVRRAGGLRPHPQGPIDDPRSHAEASRDRGERR